MTLCNSTQQCHKTWTRIYFIIMMHCLLSLIGVHLIHFLWPYYLFYPNHEASDIVMLFLCIAIFMWLRSTFWVSPINGLMSVLFGNMVLGVSTLRVHMSGYIHLLSVSCGLGSTFAFLSAILYFMGSTWVISTRTRIMVSCLYSVGGVLSLHYLTQQEDEEVDWMAMGATSSILCLLWMALTLWIDRSFYQTQDLKSWFSLVDLFYYHLLSFHRLSDYYHKEKEE